MRWIRTAAGDKAHIVFNRHDRTACGIRIVHAAAIVRPSADDRCANCDHEWREHGAKKRRELEDRERQIRAAEADVYEPRFSFKDWEASS